MHHRDRRSTISRLTSGRARPRVSRSTAWRSSTATTVCGLPTLRWAAGRAGSTPRARPAGRGVDVGDVAHRRRGDHGVRVVRRFELDAAKPGVGVDRDRATASPRRTARAWAKQRTPLPLISARLPSALNSTIRALAPASLSPINSPSAPTPRRRSHTARANAAQVRFRGVDVEGDEEVVAESVVLDQLEGVHVVRASITLVRTSASGSAAAGSMSIQRTRGSRRNHRSCRVANRRRSRDDLADGLVEADEPVEVVEQLLVAERLARRR